MAGEASFIYLLPFCVYSLEKCLFESSTHFFQLGYLVLLLSCRNSLCLDINPLLIIDGLQVFSPDS